MIKTVVITHHPVKSVNLYDNKNINYWKRIFSLKRAILIYSYTFTFLGDVLQIIAEYDIMECDVESTSGFWELLLKYIFIYRYLSTVSIFSIFPQFCIKSLCVSLKSFKPQLKQRKYLFSIICKPSQGEDEIMDDSNTAPKLSSKSKVKCNRCTCVVCN